MAMQASFPALAGRDRWNPEFKTTLVYRARVVRRDSVLKKKKGRLTTTKRGSASKGACF